MNTICLVCGVDLRDRREGATTCSDAHRVELRFRRRQLEGRREVLALLPREDALRLARLLPAVLTR